MHKLLIIFNIIIVGSSALPQGYNYYNSINSNDYQTVNYQKPVQYFNKQFFIYNAPEEEFSHDDSLAQQNLLLKKNLNVVVIKAPQNNGVINAVNRFVNEQISTQTAIYVLNKQTDINDLKRKFESLKAASSTKPDVHYIKYKTPQEAFDIQRSIQSQYDHLSGSTQISYEGYTPVISFVQPKAKTYQSQQISDSYSTPPSNNYLPPFY